MDGVATIGIGDGGSLIVAPTTVGPPERQAPVVPWVYWDAEDGRLFTMTRPEVVAWLDGELEDADGSVEAWHAKYLQQTATPGFAAALAELESLLRAAVERDGLSAFEVNAMLLPKLLGERLDLQGGLNGTAATPPNGPGECYRVTRGTLYCAETWLIFCQRWSCNSAGTAGTCTVTEPIPCPPTVSIGGSVSPMQNNAPHDLIGPY